jgi:hypothetical protein
MLIVFTPNRSLNPDAPRQRFALSFVAPVTFVRWAATEPCEGRALRKDLQSSV